jgi:hypothetical protein
MYKRHLIFDFSHERAQWNRKKSQARDFPNRLEATSGKHVELMTPANPGI